MGEVARGILEFFRMGEGTAPVYANDIRGRSPAPTLLVQRLKELEISLRRNAVALRIRGLGDAVAGALSHFAAHASGIDPSPYRFLRSRFRNFGRTGLWKDGVQGRPNWGAFGYPKVATMSFHH